MFRRIGEEEIMRNPFRKQNTLDEYSYCIHLNTGDAPLYDMCEACCYDREEQWSYKWLTFVMKLPRYSWLWNISFRILHGKRKDDND